MSRFIRFFGQFRASSGFLFVVILTFIYFSFYAVKGERGLIRYFALMQEVSKAQDVLQKYDFEKKQWEDICWTSAHTLCLICCTQTNLLF